MKERKTNMKTNNFFSKAAVSILIVLCLAMTASQAYAEPKIDSVVVLNR